jgi:ribosomal protein S18 acetylase RimI-like enzyme
MLIRKMLPEDAAQVGFIHVKAWQVAYKGILHQSFLDSLDLEKRTEGWRKGMKENPSLVRLVAEKEGEILGFICGLNNRKLDVLPASDCELWAIYVRPGLFRSGIGRQLLAKFKEEMKRADKKRLSLWALKANEPGCRFYESQGGVLSSIEHEIKLGDQTLAEVAYEFDL